MAVSTQNMIQGPGTLYAGVFGAAEPLDSAINSAPAIAWTDLGGTSDGVNIEVDQNWAELTMDQIVDIAEQRLTKRVMTIKTNLAEPTLANLARSLNLAAPTTTGSVIALEPGDDVSSTQPLYTALLFDGFAPGTFRRRLIGRKCLQTEKVGLPYKKDGQTLIPVTFTVHYVSATIKPWRIIDSTV